MFLKNIRLKDFRGFSDHAFSFESEKPTGTKRENRQMSLILGENGTGKSNFLKAIALVTSGRDAVAELIGDPESWVQNDKKGCEIEAVLEAGNNEERTVKLEIRRTDSISTVLDRAKLSLAELDGALVHTNRSYFVLGYGASRRLNVSRRISETSSDYNHPRAQSIATLFDPEASLTPIESWAMDMDYQDKRGSLNIIKKVMSEFLRDVEFSRIDKRKRQLIFNTPQGEVPMGQLSDGFQSVAAWIGDLLFRVTEAFESYDDPLKTRGLLLIDEIDLHLHPQWQSDLLKFLRRKLPNFQIIATTHSPITAQQAEEGELYHIEYSRKKLSINQFVGSPKMLLLNQLVSSDIFGLKSDESVELREKKSRYERLANKSEPTVKQKRELLMLQEELSISPATMRSNMTITSEQLALLKKIDKELEGNN